MPPQTTFDEIERLVKKFKSLSKRERDGYNEAETRKSFILPLFSALEWDFGDIRHVTAEEKISRGYVDFAFRIGGVCKFMLETKRIGEDLNRADFAQQAIDYAYHKDVTWAVLSDFEGLKIFNAEAREANPFQAQFKEFSVDDYLVRAEELWWLSRSAMADGVLDREAEKVFKKTPRVPITQALFDNLVEWRRDLHKNLTEYNRGKLWTPKHIDDAAQRILDRLIFIRTAEDRGMESQRLVALVRELQDRQQMNELIPALRRRFRELDSIYNSELFAPHFSEDLDLGEAQTLVNIINGLDRTPGSFVRLNFDFIDADVLGRVYEQYLGSVLAKSSDVADAKQKKRKSQGIYYTPTFVVKYIIQQTLGRYLEEHGYSPSHPLRVLDPACGSGSFLIEAFRVLDEYIARETGQTHGANDMHDYARHRQILSTNIFGVDKDAQAVEVAQLNLLLKALNHREKLPKLENIRCGDSLISGTPKELEEFFGVNAKEKNAFNREREFKDVMADGGFDVIVGNPPYVRIQTLPKDEVTFFNEHYKAATGNYDIYVLFVERAMQLLKPGGVFGMILPNKFMQVDYGVGLRKLLSANAFVDRVVDFRSFQVFEAATTYTCLLFLKKQANPQFAVLAVQKKDNDGTDQIFNVPITEVSSDVLTDKAWSLGSDETRTILEKITRDSASMLDLPTQISRGSSSGADDVFILETIGRAFKTREGQTVEIEAEILRTPIYATDFGRYRFSPKANERIVFPYEVTKEGYSLLGESDLKKKFPKAYIYLSSQRKKLEARKDFQQWFGFSAARNLSVHESADLVVPLLADEGLYAELPKQKSKYCLMASGGFSISIGDGSMSPRYMLGLLNSKLLFWNLKQISNVFRGGWITCTKQYVGQLPIHRISFDDKQEKKQHDAIVTLVEEMLGLQKEYAEASREKLPRADSLKRKIDTVDAEIDALVYRLYDLSAEEIRVVDGGNK